MRVSGKTTALWLGGRVRTTRGSEAVFSTRIAGERAQPLILEQLNLPLQRGPDLPRADGMGRCQQSADAQERLSSITLRDGGDAQVERGW